MRQTFLPEHNFLKCQKETGWKSLDGNNIASIQFNDMREAKNWLEQNADVSGRYIYGNHNYMDCSTGEMSRKMAFYWREEKKLT